jgi:hypothetical protein
VCRNNFSLLAAKQISPLVGSQCGKRIKGCSKSGEQFFNNLLFSEACTKLIRELRLDNGISAQRFHGGQMQISKREHTDLNCKLRGHFSLAMAISMPIPEA